MSCPYRVVFARGDVLALLQFRHTPQVVLPGCGEELRQERIWNAEKPVNSTLWRDE